MGSCFDIVFPFNSRYSFGNYFGIDYFSFYGYYVNFRNFNEKENAVTRAVKMWFDENG